MHETQGCRFFPEYQKSRLAELLTSDNCRVAENLVQETLHVSADNGGSTLAQARAKTPFADLAKYFVDLNAGRTQYADLQIVSKDASGFGLISGGPEPRLLAFSHSDDFGRTEAAFWYDSAGNLEKVVEHHTARRLRTGIESIREYTRGENGWNDRSVVRYGDSFVEQLSTAKPSFTVNNDGSIEKSVEWPGANLPPTKLVYGIDGRNTKR